MRIALYHKEFPQGQVFTDENEVKLALMRGWVEAPWLVNEVKDAIEEREVTESHIIEHPGDDSGGSSTESSGGGSTKQRREVKKPGRKKKI